MPAQFHELQDIPNLCLTVGFPVLNNANEDSFHILPLFLKYLKK
jgi:hypothetical protein